MGQRPRSVLITGASTGIGRACVQRLAGLGWRVLAGVRRGADADALRVLDRQRIEPVILDVTDGRQIGDAAAAVADRCPEGLGGLVNNAGIVVPGPLEAVPPQMLREQFEVNVVGVAAVTQAMLGHLRRAGGRVVMVSSESGRFAAPLVGPYAMSKFALEAMSDALRQELFGQGVSVSVVQPGPVKTPIWDKSSATAEAVFGARPDDAMQARYGRLVDAVRRFVDKAARTGIEPDAVARSMVHALTARRPRTRYTLPNAWFTVRLLAHLPDRLRDRLVRRALKL